MTTKKANGFSEIEEMVGEYTEWYSVILRHLIYADVMEMVDLPSRNTAVFREWTKKARDQDLLGDGVYENLYALYEDFHKLIEELTWKAQQKRTRLALDDFERLTSYFEEFLTHLRRLERDSSLKDSGVDMLTGLRHKSVMKEDLSKEMERLSRRGRAFCIALARIDQFDKVVASEGAEKAREYTKVTADLIKRSIRSFDDAYRVEDSVFLLSLKQADITGGLAALERLKKLMEQHDVTIKIGDREMPMVLTCCIAEPVIGDHVEDLLQNLHGDLNTIEPDSGAVLEYIEMSPLQRYLKSEEDQLVE